MHAHISVEFSWWWKPPRHMGMNSSQRPCEDLQVSASNIWVGDWYIDSLVCDSPGRLWFLLTLYGKSREPPWSKSTLFRLLTSYHVELYSVDALLYNHRSKIFYVSREKQPLDFSRRLNLPKNPVFWILKLSPYFVCCVVWWLGFHQSQPPGTITNLSTTVVASRRNVESN